MAWMVKKPEVKEVQEPEDVETLKAKIKELESVKQYKKSMVEIEQPKIKVRIQVVEQLPMQPVRSMIDNDGTEVHFMTVFEYLTQLANEK